MWAPDYIKYQRPSTPLLSVLASFGFSEEELARDLGARGLAYPSPWVGPHHVASFALPRTSSSPIVLYKYKGQ